MYSSTVGRTDLDPELRSRLRRIGAILIIVGLADLVFMTVCVLNGIGIGSSLCIFALIGGMFVFSGYLPAIQVLGFLYSFIFYSFVATLPFIPFIVPVGLLATAMKFLPSGYAVTGIIYGLACLVAMYWIQRALRSKEIIEFAESRRRRGSFPQLPLRRAPFFGIAMGIVIGLFFSVTVQMIQASNSGQRAIADARGQYGKGYDYFVYSMQINYNGGAKHVSGSVAAYNSDTIKSMDFDWVE